MDLALDNLQWLMCHKAKSNQTITPLDRTSFQLQNYFST